MNKLKMFATLFAAMIFAAGVNAQSVEDVNAKYNEAGEQLQARNFAGAIPLLEETIALGAQAGADAAETVGNAQKYLPTAYFQAGRSLAAQQQYDDAIAHLIKARDLGELHGDMRTNNNAATMIGQVYFVMGADAYNADDYTKAIDIFSKGYEAAPNNTQLALNLAKSYEKVGDLDKAIEVYQSVIALENRYSRYKEDADKAKDELSQTMLERAAAAASEKNLDEVIQYTGVIFEYDENNELAHLIRVQAANNANNHRAVIEYGDAAAEAQTDAVKKSDAYFLLGAAYQNLDNKPKAIEAFRKVTEGPNVAAARKLITDLN